MRNTTIVRVLPHEPSDVSAFLADLCNDSAWRTEVMRTRLVGGVGGQAGALYHETLTWEGMHADASLEVTEFTPGSRLVIVAQDPGYDSTSEYEFEPADGGTRLTLSMDLQTKGTLRLMEPFMWAMVARWIERDLDRLADVLEERAAV